MPVIAEYIHKPSDQDLIDLAAIAGALRDDVASEITECQTSAKQLYAGRFNGRLLASAWISPATDNKRELQQLQVRDITRRRGVARQFVSALQKHPSLKGTTLLVTLKPGEEYLSAPLEDLGFTVMPNQPLHYSFSTPAA